MKNTSRSLEILPNLAIKISFTTVTLMRMFPLRIVESFMRKQQQNSEKPWQHRGGKKINKKKKNQTNKIISQKKGQYQLLR